MTSATSYRFGSCDVRVRSAVSVLLVGGAVSQHFIIYSDVVEFLERKINKIEAFRKKFIRVFSGATVEKLQVVRTDVPGLRMSGLRVRVCCKRLREEWRDVRWWALRAGSDVCRALVGCRCLWWWWGGGRCWVWLGPACGEWFLLCVVAGGVAVGLG